MANKKNHFPTPADAAARNRKAFPGGGNTRLNLTAPGGNPETVHRIVGGTDLGQKTKPHGKKKS